LATSKLVKPNTPHPTPTEKLFQQTLIRKSDYTRNKRARGFFALAAY